MKAGYERLKLIIAYDGRSFRGWQSQTTKDAVQDHLERSLAKLVGERVVVHGAGRTDAGVHALGQVAHIDVPRGKFPIRTWILAINSGLPPEARVLRIQKVSPRFHARFDASGKVYAYRIWASPVLHPLEIGRVWHMPIPLDLELLRAGADLICGTHDYSGFVVNRGHEEKDTVRTIRSIRISRKGPLVTLRFEGTGFLYKMVRMLTGSLVRCAQGRAPLDWLEKTLKTKGAAKSHFAAPAEGLYLERVLYLGVAGAGDPD